MKRKYLPEIAKLIRHPYIALGGFNKHPLLLQAQRIEKRSPGMKIKLNFCQT